MRILRDCNTCYGNIIGSAIPPMQILVELLGLTQLTAAADHRPIGDAIQHFIYGFALCIVLFLIRHDSSPVAILPRDFLHWKCQNPLR